VSICVEKTRGCVASRRRPYTTRSRRKANGASRRNTSHAPSMVVIVGIYPEIPRTSRPAFPPLGPPRGRGRTRAAPVLPHYSLGLRSVSPVSTKPASPYVYRTPVGLVTARTELTEPTVIIYLTTTPGSGARRRSHRND